jgi:2-polyprenyl-3-methyl-5-hydroxy-6-metoxy-1,4-benzoquinol methylase
MSACCSSLDDYFDEESAQADLRRYRRGRLDAPTRRLLRAVRPGSSPGQAPGSNPVPAATSVLDIGGGVGLITHELLRGSEATATYVDGSSAHVRAAREEAERQGHAGRVRFLHGDFLDLADDIEPADVVVMHRVVCCYPDAEALLAAAAGRARRVLALSYPHDAWPARTKVAIDNWIRGRRSIPFRAYVHPQSLIESTLFNERPGSSPGPALERWVRDGTLLWRVDVYGRPAGSFGAR